MNQITSTLLDALTNACMKVGELEVESPEYFKWCDMMLDAEDRLRREITELEQRNADMLWELAGCLTVAEARKPIDYQSANPCITLAAVNALAARCDAQGVSGMTPEELAAIRERANAATAGPWSWDEPFDNWIAQNSLGYLDVRDSDDTVIAVLEIKSEKDADFIAKSRSDVPALLDEIDRLQVVERKAIEQSEYIQTHGLTEYEVERLRAEITQLRAMLRQLEWRHEYAEEMWPDGLKECVVCHNRKMNSHAIGCALAALLSEEES